jgi:hypothetical protein
MICTYVLYIFLCTILNIERLQKIIVRPLDHLQLKIFLKQNIWLHGNIVEHIYYVLMKHKKNHLMEYLK